MKAFVVVLVVIGGCGKSADKTAEPAEGSSVVQGGDEPVRETTPEAAAYMKKLAAHLDEMCKCPDYPCVEEMNKKLVDPAPSDSDFSEADEKIFHDMGERMMGCIFRIRDPKGAQEYTAKRIAAEAKRAKLIPTLDEPIVLDHEESRPHFDKALAEVKKACACTTQECADAFLEATKAPLMPPLKSEKDADRYLDMVVWMSTCIDPIFSATLEKKFNRH